VASLIPYFRHSSVIDIPASASFKILIICSSLYLPFFIPCLPVLSVYIMQHSNYKWHCFRGAGPYLFLPAPCSSLLTPQCCTPSLRATLKKVIHNILRSSRKDLCKR